MLTSEWIWMIRENVKIKQKQNKSEIYEYGHLGSSNFQSTIY